MHIHWDHIGGHKYFPDFYVHAKELDWLNGRFPIPLETVKEMVVDRCDLPEGFDINAYEIFQGAPTKVLTDRIARKRCFSRTSFVGHPAGNFNSYAKAFEQMKADGKLHHGSGTYSYGDWGYGYEQRKNDWVYYLGDCRLYHNWYWHQCFFPKK